MITSTMILLLVIGAAWQFSFAYCRTLLATYEKVALSSRVKQVAGLTSQQIEPAEFSRLMMLVHVAPDPGDDAAEIKAVRAYYGMVSVLERAASLFSTRAMQWCDAELARCSYFAAVTLDRRLVTGPE
jgi:hypothetical protein